MSENRPTIAEILGPARTARMLAAEYRLVPVNQPSGPTRQLVAGDRVTRCPLGVALGLKHSPTSSRMRSLLGVPLGSPEDDVIRNFMDAADSGEITPDTLRAAVYGETGDGR